MAPTPAQVAGLFLVSQMAIVIIMIRNPLILRGLVPKNNSSSISRAVSHNCVLVVRFSIRQPTRVPLPVPLPVEYNAKSSYALWLNATNRPATFSKCPRYRRYIFTLFDTVSSHHSDPIIQSRRGSASPRTRGAIQRAQIQNSPQLVSCSGG